MRLAGLSIEGSKVRASFVAGRMGVVTPIGADELTLPPGTEERGAALREALAGWKDAHSRTGVAVGVDLAHFSSRVVELPVRSSGDIRSALPFEMEKHLPLEPEQYCIDFLVMGPTPTGSRSLVLALRKEKIGWLLESIAGAGLKVLAVRCNALEGVNELLLSKNLTDGILVHPQEDVYEVVGIKDSRAAALKVVHGPEEAAREVERLAGTFGRLLYVAGDVGAPALQHLHPRALEANFPYLAAASAIRKRPVSLDFVPPEYAAPKKDYYPYAFAALAALSVLIFFLTSALSYYKDRSALRQISSRIEEIKDASKEFAASKKELETLDGKISFLLEFSNRKNHKIRVLTELSRVLPKDAYLTSVSADEKGKVEIEGFARRAADIVGPLEDSPLFEAVEFTSPVTVRDGRERFSLRMQAEQ